MKYLKIFFNGLIKENPTFVLLLGMCPTLGTTSSALNGMSMGLATTAVLICSNFIISLIKNLVPDMVRIPSFVVVIASLVTVLQMLIEAYAPAINESLGLFIPLIVVNCIILGRAEAFAAKNGAVESIFDGIGIGLGFTFALTLLGGVRELLAPARYSRSRYSPRTTEHLSLCLHLVLSSLWVISSHSSTNLRKRSHGIHTDIHHGYFRKQCRAFPVPGNMSLPGCK